MEDLIDIQGLDPISWWPLALGWWILIAFAVIALITVIFVCWRKLKYRRSWQHKAFVRLENLNTQLGIADHKQILQDLSVEMRKIAMLTTKREACAGLIGKQWLQWLQDHDPLSFKWLENGKPLIDVQYMPDTVTSDITEIGQLIIAAKGWVQKC